MDFKSLFVGIMLIGLFSFALISMDSQFSKDNDTNNSLDKDSRFTIAFGNLSKQLNESGTMTEAQRQAIASDNSNQISKLVFLVYTSIANGIMTFLTYSFGIFTTIILLGGGVLMIPPWVIGVLSSILLFVLIIGLWRVYKAGE